MTPPAIEVQELNAETPATTTQGNWLPSGYEMWKFQTSDGYLGNAYWRVAGAAIAVTRPDGTDLFRKTWGAREIFPAAWPGMFEWLKGQVTQKVTADRATRANPDESPGPGG